MPGHIDIGKFLGFFVLLTLASSGLILQPTVAGKSTALPRSDEISPYFQLGLEAANWITSFQVTPPNASWGIAYPDERVWGLDPYYFDNGTITGGDAGIEAGERQKFAFLIAGHDSGLGAQAALDAYLYTRDPAYLTKFLVYLGHFEGSQIPGPRTETPQFQTLGINGVNTTIDNSGYWAEQANVAAGSDGVFGTNDDQTSLLAIYASPEHGNPIATALISYYRWTQDETVLRMLNGYGNWLVNTQVRSGKFAGAFPVTQYYWAVGWKPRMYETTESAWILSELYRLTGNRTYLNAAVAAGRYMLSRQFTLQTWNDHNVDGALPYEWNGTSYNNSVSTNHAGFTLLAWSQLYRLTGDPTFLVADERYAKWLMSFQVTEPGTAWGNNAYSNDSMALGGFYYGYNTENHTFGSRVAESLWSASYAIRGLLVLYQLTGEDSYLQSALLAADWLTHMRYSDSSFVPLQALAITKYVYSSWWGLFPQFYQPSMQEVVKAGITAFVAKGRSDQVSIRNPNRSWFEKAFQVDFNLIDYQMASRGDRYMKMLWSWWPDVGFEPRYGGDVSFGAFAIANYLRFQEQLQNTTRVLKQVQKLTGNQTTWLPKNFTVTYGEALRELKAAIGDFGEGWYSIAVAKLEDATKLASAALNQASLFVPIRETEQLLTVLVVALVASLVTVSFYWKTKLSILQVQMRKRKRKIR